MTEQEFSINIIGMGYVGGAISHLCEINNIDFNVYDIQVKEGNFNYFNNISELVNFNENKIIDKNYYVVCVPTPSDQEGNCDVSIVDKILSELNEKCTKNSVIIIKSTLVPGSCIKFSEKYKNIDIVLSPEFLKELSFKEDMYNAKFILLGTNKFSMIKYQNLLYLFRKLYNHNPLIDILSKTYEECELFKYTLNTFLATKITFFNEIHEICEKMDVDYQKLKELFKLDPRVGNYGIEVPGPDGNFSFSGKCLPKEICGMIKLQEKLELSSEFMNCVKKRGDDFRIKQVKN